MQTVHAIMNHFVAVTWQQPVADVAENVLTLMIIVVSSENLI